MKTVHLVTGEYPPARGGVGDYTRALASALVERGVAVHVWSRAGAPSGAVRVHLLPDDFGPASRRALGEALASDGGTLLLQYVPNALGRRGANVAFCAWLARMGRVHDVRVMFHEPYFYFGWQHPARNALALVQRVMAVLLLRASSVAYLSSETWRHYLEGWAPVRTRIVVTPIPATVSSNAAPQSVARWRQILGAEGDTTVVGHFGTYGEHVAGELRRVVPLILQRSARCRVACLGRGSELFAAGIERAHPSCAGRITSTGTLPAEEIAAALRACDIALQPYPDGVTTRRTSVMAGLANGVPTVSTRGALTESVWSRTNAVALAAAGDPDALASAVLALERDETARRDLGARGQRLYEAEFAMARTVDALVARERRNVEVA